MKKFMLHRIAVFVVAAALGSAVIATDAAALGGGGAGHGGGSTGGGYIGGGMGGGRIGGGSGGGHFGGFAGRFDHGHHGRVRGLAVPLGYYDDWYSGYYDPWTVTPDEQPTYPTAAYRYVKPPRPSCSTQTYKVPSEAGGEASINVVRC